MRRAFSGVPAITIASGLHPDRQPARAILRSICLLPHLFPLEACLRGYTAYGREAPPHFTSGNEESSRPPPAATGTGTGRRTPSAQLDDLGLELRREGSSQALPSALHDGILPGAVPQMVDVCQIGS